MELSRVSQCFTTKCDWKFVWKISRVSRAKNENLESLQYHSSGIEWIYFSFSDKQNFKYSTQICCIAGVSLEFTPLWKILQYLVARSWKIWGRRKRKSQSWVNTVILYDPYYAHYFISVLFATFMLGFQMGTWDRFKVARLTFVYAS